MAEQPSVNKKEKPRSPSFPFVSLGKAIDLAGKLYVHEKKSSTLLDVLATHWGYKPKSSGFLQSVAALKRFGLLDESGGGETRKVAISMLAVRILMEDDSNGSDRLKAIQEAALMPSLYSELWSEYGKDLPSDASLVRKLVVDKGFTESAAKDFVVNFRDTIAYSKLGELAPIPGGVGVPLEGFEENFGSGSEAIPPTTLGQVKPSQQIPVSIPKPAPGTREITLPAGGGYALFRAPYPLTKEVFKRLMRTLTDYEGEFVKDSNVEEKST